MYVFLLIYLSFFKDAGVGVTKDTFKRQLGNYPKGFEKYRLGIWVEIGISLKVFKLLLAKCPEDEKEFELSYRLQ